MQLSLFSISYAGLWGQAALDLTEFLRHVRSLGFDAVMLAGKRPHLSPLDADDDTLAKLREDLHEAGLKCPVIAAYTDLRASAAAEVPYVEMQIAYLESLCRVGARLGATVLRVFTAYESGGGLLSGWSEVVSALREVCDRAAPHGVTVAIQNHHDVAVHTTALLELLHDVERSNCKLGFDAWSPALRGEDLHEAALLAAPHTAITTNADYVRLPRYRYRPEAVNYERIEPDLVRAVPFGSGFIDYRRFFEGLREGGFDGVATYEMCSPIRGGGSLDNLDRYARTYVRWMREHGYR
jgi:sugar phosphate isomerase/epimerase